MTTNDRLANNIAQIQQRIQRSQQQAAGASDDVTLLAVSKTRSSSEVESAYQLGLRHFGENYLQEALQKQLELSQLDICWHFIGPIQANKTSAIAEHFSWVHSVDREKIARRLNAQRPNNTPALNICLQVNLNAEANKAGLAPEDCSAFCAALGVLPKLSLRGLMAIPIKTAEPQRQRENFAALHTLLSQLRQDHPQHPWDTLSMGMSADFEAAITEGATIVRIGSDIFGPREAKTTGSIKAD
ncbi:MAG: YggS family pyridoxal phosphate-dependent enzyme [Spongiibacteraceae bacterium]